MECINVNVLAFIVDNCVKYVNEKNKERNNEALFIFIYLNTKDTSPCQSNPCLNGGICLANANTCSFSCTCQTSFTGPFCAQSIIFIFRVNSKNCNLKLN